MKINAVDVKMPLNKRSKSPDRLTDMKDASIRHARKYRAKQLDFQALLDKLLPVGK